MEIDTKYFGVTPYTEDEVITFQNGIFGFEENRRFILIRFEDENGGLLCLQNIENAQLAFVVINPFCFMPEYKPVLAEAELKRLEADSSEELLFYNICVLDEDIEKSSVNLRCPLAVNGETKQALQVILEDTQYAFKQPFHEFAVKEK